MSIHIGAAAGAIAESILLPGDPYRARFIAEHFLESPVLFNEVRGMLGYTGTWKGKRVSVMGTGMGQPSLSIYVHELICDYGVKNLVRVGTCGAMKKELSVFDIVLAISASTDSANNKRRFQGMDYAATADFGLLSRAHAAALRRPLKAHVGPIVSTDSFYNDSPETWKLWARYGVIAVEMESAELYTVAAREGAHALSVLTVSDSLVDGSESSSQEREKKMPDMVEIALEALLG